jgi:hypothetical protein
MQTDVLASAVRSTDGQMLDQSTGVIGRTRVKAVYIVPSVSGGAAVAGTVVLRDGGVSGDVRVTLNTLEGSTTPDYITFPGEGILFRTNVYADVTKHCFSICHLWLSQQHGHAKRASPRRAV